MNFYKRHLGDYAKDTPHLPMMEHGAYTLLLDYYYATERPLPKDMPSIFRICRAMTKPERDAVQSVVDQFFPVSDDGMRHNKRADSEIERSSAQRDVNRELGKRGGRPKKTESVTESKTESVSESEPINNPSQTPDSRQLLTPPLPPSAEAKGGAINGHRKRKRKPKSECPSAFEISDPMFDWANGKGLADDRIEHETEAFLAHHKAKGSEWADWQAAWRNWMLNAVKFAQERGARA
jgi:uncharacterized protein YdaU (DUF1376 family)